jgi:hypothetical protein
VQGGFLQGGGINEGMVETPPQTSATEKTERFFGAGFSVRTFRSQAKAIGLLGSIISF